MKPFEPAGPAMLTGRWRLLRVRASRAMAAPPAAVWETISDHTTWTRWHEDYDEHDAVSEQVRGVGARFATREWILRSEAEVVRWEEGASLGWTIVRARGLRWLLSSYYSELTVEPVEGDPTSCTVGYRIAFSGTWLFWLLAAYTVGYSLGSVYLDARSSLKKLEADVVGRRP